MMKAYVCNKCGRVVTNDKILRDMTRLDVATDYLGKYQEFHLCDECKEKVFEYIREGE